MDKFRLSEKEFVTIEDVKPADRHNGYPLHVPRWFTKIFEIIPGAITWFFLLLPFLIAFSGYPEIMVIYMSFLTVYWGLRGIRFLYGVIISYRRMNRDLKVDWAAKLKDENLPYQDLNYVLICPIVNEGMEVLDPALTAWANSDIGSEKISIVFALEERFSAESKVNTKKLIEKFGSKFREMVEIVHPNNIEGEVEGVKGANINWATRLFVEKVTDRGEKLEDYVLITCDSDLRPHEKYLSAITYKYLTVANPRRKFFATAIHTYNNNIFRVPVMIRIFSSSLTLALMQEWIVSKNLKETFSSYVVNLKTVEEVGYWDPQIGIDDTTFYYNALIRFAGDFSGEEIYIPTHNDAVENQTAYKSYHSLYKQQLRWGWGSIVFPMTFAGLYKNKEIPVTKKLKIIGQIIDDRLVFRTVIFTITFGLPIMSLLSPEFQFTSAAYNLPKLMSAILTGVSLFTIPIVYVRRKLTGVPKEWSALRNIQDFVEIILISINLLTFGFLPFLQAQTEMMLGKGFRKRYYATEKVAIKK
jgi:hypothetical protein